MVKIIYLKIKINLQKMIVINNKFYNKNKKNEK